MKKVLLVSALVLTIITSMVSGTLAIYNVNLGTVASGSVIAKEFKLTAQGEADFTTNVLIAPTETVTMTFTVSNIDGAIVAEVPMDLDISVGFAAASGKSIIVPLTAEVKESGVVVSTGTLTNGAGTLSIVDELTDITVGETKTYTVEITWPDTANDMDYAGSGFGTALTVTVAGTQQ